MAAHEEQSDLRPYSEILRKDWWKVALFSLAVGIITLLAMFQMVNIYQAGAVITPAPDEKRQNPALGALASFGVEIGGTTKLEDLETLFKSNDLTIRVFRKHNLWPIVLPDRFDPATGTLKRSPVERLLGGKGEPKPPGNWDAIRAAKDRLKVSANRRAGTLRLSFESPSADGSAEIVSHYLEEGKSRLQEESLDRATKNKKFIEDQIARTVDPLTRDRLYTLYGQEVEREMLARNREQFGFRVVDAALAPDRKFKPRRATGAAAAFALSFILGCWYLLGRGRK